MIRHALYSSFIQCLNKTFWSILKIILKIYNLEQSKGNIITLSNLTFNDQKNLLGHCSYALYIQ